MSVAMDPWVIQPLSERYLSDKPGRQKSTLLPKSYGVIPVLSPTAASQDTVHLKRIACRQSAVPWMRGCETKTRKPFAVAEYTAFVPVNSQCPPPSAPVTSAK